MLKALRKKLKRAGKTCLKGQKKQEPKSCFNISRSVKKIPGNADVLGIGTRQNGKSAEGKVYSLKKGCVPTAHNTLVIASTSAGKEDAYIKPSILQNIRRGNSVVVLDTNGELYTETVRIAAKCGYRHRSLDLRPESFVLAGCDLLGPLRDGDDMKATILATTIIANTLTGERMDHWADAELHLLKALMLYMACDGKLQDERRANLPFIYDIITENTVMYIDRLFENLPEKHPAMASYQKYASLDYTAKEQVLNGLAKRFATLSDKHLRDLVTGCNIGLTWPMEERCIYYVILPPDLQKTPFIVPLFFSELFHELFRYSDSVNPDKRIPVTVMLNGIANIGVIPRLPQIMSVAGSRGISITVTAENFSQLEQLYPGEAPLIADNSFIKVLLGNITANTARDFSTYYPDLTEDNLTGMQEDHLVVLANGFAPVELKKFSFAEYKEAQSRRKNWT
ncbi:MAG: type IV secretory system conjugative DNA transfer family protein [Lachnospiraceae bacterium]|nr:type IV secretory system conjugative DNA transfer family protein [Lachnospiraceae bacterium]